MIYSVSHITRYLYTTPVHENVTEIRKRPRSDGLQRCLSFELSTHPSARVEKYQDYLGNTVHHFDIPGEHLSVTMKAEAQVEVQPFPTLPEALSEAEWGRIDTIAEDPAYWDFVHPSKFATYSALLLKLKDELKLGRQKDPLNTLLDLNTALYDLIAYTPESTSVDSPIDEALTTLQGVCQDYSHIMISLVRSLNIPCRYVSGYLFHRTDNRDRSAVDASHAWVEAYLPELGWIGFDPTNNLVAGERHIRVAVGRDYADVPPTRGVFKGEASDEISVNVRVALIDALPEEKRASLPPIPDGRWMQAAQQQ